MSSGSKLRAVTGGGDGAQRGLRVVIADDDRDTATMLAVILRDEGHEVHTVLRGDEVAEACRLMRPDVVVADINMPGMSGYAVAKELRQRHGPLAPLLIAISGVWTQAADRKMGEVAGFDHYLLKPCDPRELLPLLEPLRSPNGLARRVTDSR